jgi:hypothetical protein
VVTGFREAAWYIIEDNLRGAIETSQLIQSRRAGTAGREARAIQR